MTLSQKTSESVDVGAFDEFKPGVPVVERVHGRELVIVRWGDEMFALRNVCPHQTQSFEGGHVRHELFEGGAPGQLTVRRDRPALSCPWHAWTYDLRDGKCTADPDLRVRTYAVEVRNGRVMVGEAPATSGSNSR